MAVTVVGTKVFGKSFVSDIIDCCFVVCAVVVNYLLGNDFYNEV